MAAVSLMKEAPGADDSCNRDTGLSLEASKQKKAACSQIICACYFVNCDLGQKMSIFELILTSMSDQKKLLKYVSEYWRT